MYYKRVLELGFSSLRIYAKSKIIKRLNDNEEGIIVEEKIVDYNLDLVQGSYRTVGPQGYVDNQRSQEEIQQRYFGANSATFSERARIPNDYHEENVFTRGY